MTPYLCCRSVFDFCESVDTLIAFESKAVSKEGCDARILQGQPSPFEPNLMRVAADKVLGGRNACTPRYNYAE